VLIVDADGQHQPPTHGGSSRGSASSTSWSAPGRKPPRRRAPRLVGNAALNRLAGYLTGRPIPDLTSGFRAARREYLARVHPPPAQRLLHADHERRSPSSAPGTTSRSSLSRRGPASASSKIRLARDGREVLPHPAAGDHHLQPFRVFLPISLASFLLGFAYAVWNLVASTSCPTVPCCSCCSASSSSWLAWSRNRSPPAHRGPRLRPMTAGRGRAIRSRPAAGPVRPGRPAAPARVRARLLAGQAPHARRARSTWRPASISRRAAGSCATLPVRSKGPRLSASRGRHCTRGSWRWSCARPGSRSTGLPTQVPRALQAVQCVLGALAVWLLAAIARRSAGPVRGVATAALGAVYPPFVWMPAYALSESLFFPSCWGRCCARRG